MLRSLFIKLAMLGVTLGALIWIGSATPSRHVAAPKLEPAAAVPVTAPSQAQASAPTSTQQRGNAPPVAAEESPAATDELPPKSLVAAAQSPAPDPALPRKTETRRVDLNHASVTELEGLPGIGPKLAQRVVDHRAARGPFGKVEDLRQVKGIGQKKFDRLRPYVLVTNTKAPSRH